MCKFTKTKKTAGRTPRIVSHSGLRKTNVVLSVVCAVGIMVFAFVSLLNISSRLSLSKLERETHDLGVANNSLSIEVSRAQVGVTNAQKLDELGLVDVGDIEYARSQSSAVALR